ncbi:MAG: glycosyltransferase family 2 protein [Candidatus Cryptobacteroides sp.]
MPKVSIIVPIYNVEKYIEKCASSLFQQTYKNVEYIFVDDCGGDNSIKILERLVEEKYPELKDNILIIPNEKNLGPSKSRLEGIKKAKGEYILFVDSDDWIEKNTLDILIKRAEEKGADLIYYNFFFEYADEVEIMRYKDYGNDKELFIKDLINNRSHNAIWSKFAKKDLYTAEGFFFPNYNVAEDMIISFQIIQNAKNLCFEPSALYHYNITNENSLTHKSFQQCQYMEAMNILDVFCYFEDKGKVSPISSIKNVMLYVAAYYAWHYDTEFLSVKGLAEKVLKAGYEFDSHIKLHIQVKLKLFALYYILKSKL